MGLDKIVKLLSIIEVIIVFCEQDLTESLFTQGEGNVSEASDKSRCKIKYMKLRQVQNKSSYKASEIHECFAAWPNHRRVGLIACRQPI
eukprot:9287920-Karenia_brevis.AAC.1